MIEAIWDNGGKSSIREFNVIKGGRVYVCNPMGTWEFICTDTYFEIDKAWMDKYWIRSDFSELPVNVQRAAEEMMYVKPAGYL